MKQTTTDLPATLTATTADHLALYERSVQDCEITIEMLDNIYRSRNSYSPLRLREDFCGTGRLCADWVRSDPDRTAEGLDLDHSTLSWGLTNNVTPLDGAANRVQLLERDVRHGGNEKADIIVAFNFSYCVFHDRDELARYFAGIRSCLPDDGLFMIDLYGGPDAQFSLEEETDHEDFTYVWEQGVFDPISGRTINHIHFRFPDGTALDRAFTYDWRVWSLPELRDLLREAGFNEIEVWWDDDNDMLRSRNSVANTESWIAYIAAWR